MALTGQGKQGRGIREDLEIWVEPLDNFRLHRQTVESLTFLSEVYKVKSNVAYCVSLCLLSYNLPLTSSLLSPGKRP